MGKNPKNQVGVRMVVYRGKGHKAAWLMATDRMDLSAQQVASLYSRRMGIESGFRDTKGGRYGWGLRQVGLRSDVELTQLWGAAMVAYGLRMGAGAAVVKKDAQAQFDWTTKGPRRSLLSVGRNAISSGLMKSEEIIKQLPKLALRLSDLKLIASEKPVKKQVKSVAANS